MKKIFLFLIPTFLVFHSQAQIKNGDILLGGNIGYIDQTYKPDVTNTNSNTTKNSALSVEPSFGRAIQDNLVLGFDLTYDHQKTTYTNPAYVSTLNTYGAGVFLRKYKYLGSGFYLFGQGRLGFFHVDGNTNNQTSPMSTKESEQNVSFGFYPGIAFAISRRWQIETGFPNLFYANYDHSKQTTTAAGQPDTHDIQSAFSIGSSLSNTYQFTVGLRYII